MPEDRDPDAPEPDEPPSGPSTDGVRIIGAEPVSRSPRDPDEGSPDHFEIRPAAPVPPAAVSRRPRFPDEGPSWSATTTGEPADPPEPSDAGTDPYEGLRDDEIDRAATAERSRRASEEPATAAVVFDGLADDEPATVEEPSGAVELPHWTEPPTGSTPAVGADADDLDAWAALGSGGPRFRSEESDWDEADFGTGDLTDEHTRIGAMAEEAVRPEDDDAFAAEVAARRRGGTRTPPPVRAGRSAGEAVPTEPTSGPRDLPTALATAGIIGVVVLVAFSQGPAWTAWLAAVIVALATLELCSGLRTRGLRAATPVAVVGAAGLVVAAREYGVHAYPVVVGLVVVVSLVWFLLEASPGRPVIGVAATLLAFGWVGVLGGFAGLLLASEHGVGLLLGAALCVIAYDVAGFFVGSQFGSSRIAPRISPNKTFEGTLAGMVASAAIGFLIVGRIHPWDGGSGLLLGVLLAAAAFLGDLSESMVKRDLGIKDFGTLLPGHGGVLDRFDSILFALPVTYYLAVHLGPF